MRILWWTFLIWYRKFPRFPVQQLSLPSHLYSMLVKTVSPFCQNYLSGFLQKCLRLHFSSQCLHFNFSLICQQCQESKKSYALAMSSRKWMGCKFLQMSSLTLLSYHVELTTVPVRLSLKLEWKFKERTNTMMLHQHNTMDINYIQYFTAFKLCVKVFELNYMFHSWFKIWIIYLTVKENEITIEI